MIKKLVNYTRSRLRKYLFEEIWLEDFIKRGMVVGTNCSIQPGVTFDYSHCWLIKIGNNVTIAPQAYLLAHDASTKKINDFTKIGSITIEDNVFIGARAVIMPGVTIGENSIIAAGSIVTRNVPKDTVVAGNPARVISDIESYKIKSIELFDSSLKYDKRYTVFGEITDLDKVNMYNDLRNKIGFIE